MDSDQQNNVIDFKSKQQESTGSEKKPDLSPGQTEADLFDMTQRRAEILKEERREVKRTILTEFIGAFVVVPEKGLQKVALFDISENGIAFDMDEKIGRFAPEDQVAVRVYLNNQTYFPFSLCVKNVRFDTEEQVYRHGGDFVKGDTNELALFHFVKFIETVSASLSRDKGDIMVSNIGR